MIRFLGSQQFKALHRAHAHAPAVTRRMTAAGVRK